MGEVVISGWSGMYELLLIALVIVLIYNGIQRSKALSKINDNLDNHNSKSSTPKTPINEDKKGEYVDYEIIND